MTFSESVLQFIEVKRKQKNCLKKKDLYNMSGVHRGTRFFESRTPPIWNIGRASRGQPARGRVLQSTCRRLPQAGDGSGRLINFSDNDNQSVISSISRQSWMSSQFDESSEGAESRYQSSQASDIPSHVSSHHSQRSHHSRHSQ